MYPDIKPFFSKQTKSVYWKGKINLINNTSADFLILESMDATKASYSITLTGSNAQRFKCRELYLKRSFASAWKAVWSFEQDLNREIFNNIENNNL